MTFPKFIAFGFNGLTIDIILRISNSSKKHRNFYQNYRKRHRKWQLYQNHSKF